MITGNMSKYCFDVWHNMFREPETEKPLYCYGVAAKEVEVVGYKYRLTVRNIKDGRHVYRVTKDSVEAINAVWYSINGMIDFHNFVPYMQKLKQYKTEN